MLLLGYMRSEVPPPMGPATVPIRNRPAPNHEGYLKENAAAGDEGKIGDQLAKNERDNLLAQLSHGSGFPEAMKELNDMRDNLRAPKAPLLGLASESPHTDSDPEAFNGWLDRIQRGELSDLPPPIPDDQT